MIPTGVLLFGLVSDGVPVPHIQGFPFFKFESAVNWRLNWTLLGRLKKDDNSKYSKAPHKRNHCNILGKHHRS